METPEPPGPPDYEHKPKPHRSGRPNAGQHGPELLVELDRDGELSLHEQLERSIREGIRAGRLPAAMSMPSTRGLATELGVSRGVVVEAYRQLAAEGYLTMRQGAPVRGERRGAGLHPARARPLAAAHVPLPLPPRPARPRGLPPRPLAALAARGAARVAARTRSATATRAGTPGCAKRSPTTSAASAAPPPTPSR